MRQPFTFFQQVFERHTGSPSSLITRLRAPLEDRVEPQAQEVPQQRQPVGNAFLAQFGGLRALGALLAAGRMMEANEQPHYHHWLKEWGVLDRLPRDWDQDALLERLPWGAGSVDAPAPRLPFGVKGPWPQEPVLGSSFYKPVLNISREEEFNHLKYNVLRYLGQATTTLPRAVLEALSKPRVEPMRDQDLEFLLQDTAMGQFIVQGLDPADVQAFSHLLERDPESYYKVDFSIVGGLEKLDEAFLVEPSVVLMDRDPQGRFKLKAIQVGQEVLEPSHTHAWELARYCVMQNAAQLMVTIWHPRLHFPCDSVHAITLSVLPDGHPIKNLILPHTPLTLGLHKAVIHHRRSVLHNNQREIYTPFPCTTQGIHAGVERGREGVPGNRSFPAYRWGEDLPGLHVPYGHYRQQWADAFFDLCRGVLADITPQDRHVAAWADHIADFVPGFPDSSAIFEGDTLAEAVSTWMRNVTVFHTADHHSYSNIPLQWAPLRLRHPSPHPQMGRVDLDALVSREDYLRHVLANELFFKPTVVFRLSEVQYKVAPGAPQQAVDHFWQEVARLDERWADSHFPTSDQIGASIHY